MRPLVNGNALGILGERMWGTGYDMGTGCCGDVSDFGGYYYDGSPLTYVEGGRGSGTGVRKRMVCLGKESSLQTNPLGVLSI